MGGLFMRPYKRVAVKDMLYLQNLILYVHQNPVAAGLCASAADWPFSSFTAIVRNDDSLVQAKQVIDCFENLENFEYLHRHSTGNADY
jgi:putative transposase